MSECVKIAVNNYEYPLASLPRRLISHTPFDTHITRYRARRMRVLRHKESAWREQVIKSPIASFDFSGLIIQRLSLGRSGKYVKIGKGYCQTVVRFRNAIYAQTRLRHLSDTIKIYEQIYRYFR